MGLSTTVTNSPKKNRDAAHINQHACELKGTLHLLMSTLIQEAQNASPNTMKQKLIKIPDINNDLGDCLAHSKKFFQAGVFEMCQKSDHNASYEGSNLKWCIRNGKNPEKMGECITSYLKQHACLNCFKT